MVSPGVGMNGNGNAPDVIKPEGVSPGNYTLVGWSMDTTGRRLIDEICHIGAYTPASTFSQYIMPHGNLNFVAIRRHNIKVVTIGRYRMLKDISSNKVLKTKSEISALTDFIEWLEEQKKQDPGSQGVILIIHEPRRVSAPMLLDALHRYNLVPRFKSTVVGFGDSQCLAAEKCQASVKSYNLYTLTKVLLDSESRLRSATERANATYKVTQHLSQGEQQDLEGKGDANSLIKSNMCELVAEYTCSVDSVLNDLSHLKTLIDKQNTFKPVFGPLLQTRREERLKAASLRRLLVEADMDYSSLKAVWDKNQLTGLEEELSRLSVNAEEDQVKELIDILDCHFDPEKESKVPKNALRRNNMRPHWQRNPQNRNRRQHINDSTNKSSNTGEEESGSTSPDTTTSGSPAKVKSEGLPTESAPVTTVVA